MKKLLKTLLILLIIGGVAAGGLYGYTRYSRSQPADVQPVSNWLLEYSPNQTYLGGTVTSNESFVLYGEKDKTLTQVFVSEGQQVQIGDPLVQFDATKDELDLAQKLLDRQKLYDSLQVQYKEYERYAREPYERTVPTATPSPSPTPREAQGMSAGRTGGTGAVRLSVQIARGLDPLSGDGTAQAPYQFKLSGSDPIPEAKLLELSAQAKQQRQTVYATFFSDIGSLDIRFDPPSGTAPNGSTSFAAFAEKWTAPRSATGTAALKGVAPAGKGTSSSPFIYQYEAGQEVPWDFISYCCRKAASTGRYTYVQLVGKNAKDIMVSLDFTSMGTYFVRLEQTPACTVTFDANGGTGTSTATVVYGSPYGKLPVPTREEYIFDGWWTARTGGEQVTAKTVVTKDHTLYARWNPKPTPTPTATPDGTPLPTETPYVPYYGGGMSIAERQAYVIELAQKIRDDELKYHQLCLDIVTLQSSNEGGMVYSTIAGVVTRVDPEAKEGDTLLEIRGGSSARIITCTLGETDLEKYPVGTEMTGFCYEIGDNVQARVTYVSPMPVTDSYSNGGNPNSSGYMMVLEVLDNPDLPLYSYVEFTSFQPLSKTGTIYLYEAFVREIDGQDYIFVDRGGVLRQEQVHTGRRVMEYIELVGSNLTREDYIAFPYGKTVRDGAATQVKEDIW